MATTLNRAKLGYCRGQLHGVDQPARLRLTSTGPLPLADLFTDWPDGTGRGWSVDSRNDSHPSIYEAPTSAPLTS